MLGVSAKDSSCAIHLTHRPKPWLLQAHHVIPVAWSTRLNLENSRWVPLCGTGHDAVHAAIRQKIAGKPTTWRLDETMEPLVSEAVNFWFQNKDAIRSTYAGGPVEFVDD